MNGLLMALTHYAVGYALGLVADALNAVVIAMETPTDADIERFYEEAR